MSKYSLFFLIGLIGGFLIGTTSVYANARAIGPQPIIPTDIAKGTLFVKPNGSGNICSMANPCDIWTAAGRAKAGDVVFLRGGTYAVTNTIKFSNHGSSGNPVIFENYPNEKVIFDGSMHSKGTNKLIQISGKFIHFRGIEIQYMPNHGLFINGTDNLIEGVTVRYSAIDGIKVFSPYDQYPYGAFGSRNIIRNCISHSNSDVGSFPGSANGGNADGIAISSGDSNRVENCLTYNNSDDGLDSWRSTNTYFGYNISHSNGLGGGDGNGVKAGSPQTQSIGTFVERNIVYGNRATGIHHNGGDQVTYINNTVWGNNGPSIVHSSEVTSKNNIAVGPLGQNHQGIEINNSWQRDGFVAFISTDPENTNFLVPTIGSGFEDIGALQPITSTSITSIATSVIGPQSIIPTDIAEGTLFVDPNGSGTTCSVANPCDIWTAINKASGGDVVFLRGGTYALSKSINIWNRASAENPIIFEGYPGESVVFDGSQHPKGTDVRIKVTGKFIHIRNIKVKDMPKHGIWINGTDNLIDGVHVHGSGLSGIQVFSPYDKFPYGAYGSRNIIRNCISYGNSGSANGGNADGIAIPSGTNNRIENCLVYGNSADGIDVWKSTNTYIGYNISHSNDNGIKAGGKYPSTDTFVEHNLVYSNRVVGIAYNSGVNLTFSNNTTWDNGASYTLGSDTIASDNIASETSKFGSGIEADNSWQRAGSVAFISTDFRSTNFLVPESNGGFEDIGAFGNATKTNKDTDTANNATTYLPDVVVTQLSYANGIFTSTVKNQGNAATPEGVAVAVGYSVDGKYKTWGGIQGPLDAGASVTISTNGVPYVIPNGTHTITAWVDDVNRFEESNENNNQLSQSITMR